MIAWWAAILPLAALLAGAGIGAAAQRRHRPICMCGDAYGSHDPVDGQCGSERLTLVNRTETWVGCSCRRYVGPDPTKHGWWVQPTTPVPPEDEIREGRVLR